MKIKLGNNTNILRIVYQENKENQIFNKEVTVFFKKEKAKTIYLKDNLIINKLQTDYKKVNIIHLNIDKDFNIETTIEFNQNDIIKNHQKLPEKLFKINLKFNGLCELICNKVLIDDLLGKGEKDFLKEKITIDELNKESIVESHLLNVYSFFSKMIAFIFSIYPDNIFSVEDQWKLVNKNKVNNAILFNGLKKIEPGTTLKLEVFKKTFTSFIGHSLLIKKTNQDTFIFFDPNKGEHRGLSEKSLAEEINNQLYQHGGTDIFISKGDTYIKRLKERKIIDLFPKIIKSQ